MISRKCSQGLPSAIFSTFEGETGLCPENRAAGSLRSDCVKDHSPLRGAPLD